MKKRMRQTISHGQYSVENLSVGCIYLFEAMQNKRNTGDVSCSSGDIVEDGVGDNRACRWFCVDVSGLADEGCVVQGYLKRRLNYFRSEYF